MKKLVRESLTEKKLSIGDEVRIEGKFPGIFVPAIVTGIKDNMIQYETDDGDFGNIKLSSPRLSI